jgi:protein NirF
MIRILLFVIVFLGSFYAKERVFVVERESSSIAVIDDEKLDGRIENVHNMNHGVVKFKDGDGYLISRDGYVVKFNPKTLKVEAEYKTSKSAIGFVIGKNYVAVANYDDKSVDILTRELEPIQKIKTGSKNVGIKIYRDYIIFAQMDNDKLTVLKDISPSSNKPNFQIFKEFKDVGKMPFDAMIKDNNYIVGFFLSKHFGVLDLNKMQYSAIKIEKENKQPVLKVPHFGFWSIGGDKVFIPAVGDNKVLVYTKDFKFIKNIKTQGLPVFTSLSPNKKHMAITFSGKDFPTIQILDTDGLKIIKKFDFDGKVLHIRWSKEKPILYVSVNTTNKIALIDTNKWEVIKYIDGVKKPSGIFIFDLGKKK